MTGWISVTDSYSRGVAREGGLLESLWSPLGLKKNVLNGYFGSFHLTKKRFEQEEWKCTSSKRPLSELRISQSVKLLVKLIVIDDAIVPERKMNA